MCLKPLSICLPTGPCRWPRVLVYPCRPHNVTITDVAAAVTVPKRRVGTQWSFMSLVNDSKRGGSILGELSNSSIRF
jgi:hypothetical protein